MVYDDGGDMDAILFGVSRSPGVFACQDFALKYAGAATVAKAAGGTTAPAKRKPAGNMFATAKNESKA